MTSSPTVRLRARRASTLGACLCAVAALAFADGSATASPLHTVAGSPSSKLSAGVSLIECVTAVRQPERSATFSGEMTTISGSTRMEMRVEVLERTSGEALFHTVSAPGLGVWRSSAPGVKVYKYLKQVTNLSAPAFYRGAVRFRWLNARGHLIKAGELRTPRCEQPASSPLQETPAPAPSPTSTPTPTPTPPA